MPRRRSSQDAFSDAFHAHHDFVYRALSYLGVPAGSVEDATQDVFVVLHRRFEELRDDVSVRPWLFGIARRVANKYRVRTARAHALRVVPPAGPPCPEREVQVQEAADWISEVLSVMDADQRDVFILAELEGLRAPEIAVAVGAKLNTVYSRLRLARRRFERALLRRQQTQRRETAHA